MIIRKKYLKLIKILGMLIILSISNIVPLIKIPQLKSRAKFFLEEYDSGISNSNQILIVNPVNTTYYSPASGFYPATHGFESEKNGPNPNDWNIEGQNSDNNIVVLERFKTHKKVLKVSSSSNDYCQATNYFSSRTKGNIEFWAYFTNNQSDWRNKILFQDLSTFEGGYLIAYNGDVFWDDGDNFIKVVSQGTGLWGHWRIDWNENDVIIYYNGLKVLKTNWDNERDNVDRIIIYSWRNTPIYIDAIGYSWDPNYNSGDNWKEGLLLTFEANFDLDWMAYSLNEQANKTIPGNTTIPIAENGHKSIQVFGNNSLGTMYHSEIIYFTVDLPEYELLSILSPKNVSYIEPMRGYYPATYGFEHDVNGDIPIGWTDISSGIYPKIHTEVINDKNHHEKVVKLYDYDEEGFAGIENKFNDIQYGTIEFYLFSTNVNAKTRIKLKDSSLGTALDFGTFADGWDGNGYYLTDYSNEFIRARDDKWYRVRIDFCCDNSQYEGLGQYRWKCSINDIHSGIYDLNKTIPSINCLSFETDETRGWIISYIDAIGYSWDNNYEIGSNKDESILLGINTYPLTNIDTIEYSLDNQENKTILGDIVIPVPRNGKHNIQIFVNDTNGNTYKSTKKFFSTSLLIESITIKSPENKIYIDPMFGYYPATYGFENDDLGAFPADWTEDTLGNSPSQYIGVINGIGGHYKVLQVKDTGYRKRARLTTSFIDQNYGTIEFYVRHGEKSGVTGVKVKDEILGSIFELKMWVIGDYGFWMDHDYDIITSGPYSPIPAFKNHWHHVTIDFCCDNSKYQGLGQYRWKCNIDGLQSGARSFNNNLDSINQFTIESEREYASAISYYDAIGFSWDSNYDIGDNKNKGILLDLETPKEMDWIGYSIDSQPNNTILGDKVITIPESGLHTIQVFGKDLENRNYQSDVRFFTYESSEIDIDIKSPQEIIYTKPMLGYYPATYGFENDLSGDIPHNWIETSTGEPPNIYAGVINAHLDHNKVLRLLDYRQDSKARIQTSFMDVSHGTIEFYFLTSDSIKKTKVILLDENLGSLLTFEMWAGHWIGNGYYIRDLSEVPLYYLEDRWYHIRIDFCCDNSRYEGLSKDTWTCNIGGVQSIVYDFDNNIDSINTITLETVTSHASYVSYFDAIGFSWDPDYNVGDNWNEGLLLGYKINPEISLDSVGYSINGQDLIPLKGNKTLPMPENGDYTLQILGTSSSGRAYQSDIISFSVSMIKILTQQNLKFVSWDDKIVLEVELPLDMDWIGYSLDGNSPVTMDEYFNIPTPEDGVHSIQLFGINSGGLEFQSGLLIFYVYTPIRSNTRTLFLLHGYGDSTSSMRFFEGESNIIDLYGTDNIINLEYYGNFMDESVTRDTPIEDIARCLRDYIIQNPDKIGDNIDFVCHSMGGLIVRYMIKHYYADIIRAYKDLERVIRIYHVCTVGTPHHGSWIVDRMFEWAWFGALMLNILAAEAGITFSLTDYQFEQCRTAFYSDFIKNLNVGDETPYGFNDQEGSWDIDGQDHRDIHWYTYAGNIEFIWWEFFLVPVVGPLVIPDHDALVNVDSVPLSGAEGNRVFWHRDHTQIKETNWCIYRVYADLLYPIESEVHLPSQGSPLSNLATEPIILSYNQDSESIILTTSLSLEGGTKIDPDSVFLNINPSYQMTLKPGTDSTFDVNISLPDGRYTYSITAKDTEGNNYALNNGELIILDDDIIPPLISLSPEDWIIFDGDIIDNILVEWNITDESSIMEANITLNGEVIGSYEQVENVSDSLVISSNIPNNYVFEFRVRDNDNDPGHTLSENDWLETFLQVNFTILDDDSTAPNASIDYSGSGFDSDSGLWNIIIEDKESGLNSILIKMDGNVIIDSSNLNGIDFKEYEIYVPNDLDIHEVEVVARNNDRDWYNDQEVTTISHAITIKDDDSIAPDILINYIGDNTDEDSGYFEWLISDKDDGIGGDHDSGFSELNIRVNYISTEGLPDQEFIITPSVSGTWNLPNSLGLYTITILATDNDDDRTLIVDSLSTEISRNQEIIDDDITPPELSNLVITAGFYEINISFDAFDEQSGIGEIQLLINEEIIDPISYRQEGINHFLTVLNDWHFKKGYSTVEIRVFDADNDRPSDASRSIILGTFSSVLYQMYQYVDWQLEELKTYIDNNISHRWKSCLIYKITRTQDNLMKAFNLIENGNITRGLCYDYIAKIYVRFAEIRTEILDRKNKIPDEIAEYIIITLHEIRNNIVILMGASTGTKLAHDIGYIEVDLLNLSDFIEQEFPCCVGKYLSRKIWCASKMLEIAIFRISKENEVECLLECTQWMLERTMNKINCFLERGKISEAQASYLNGKILGIIGKIEDL